MQAEEKEVREGVIVLDEGIDSEGVVSPLGTCCGAAYVPLIWS